MRKPIIDGNWLKHPSIAYLRSTFKDNGYELFFVGGCVRNTILNKEVNDVDITTSAQPEEIKRICNNNNIKVVPTGIKHGTVTIFIGNKTYQITTFRKDVENFGRHADVRFIDNLELDASRRDLTINALYCNTDGEIIDPLNVFEDLKLGVIRFIGDPNKRILEDHLRILRFFRFHALYGDQNKPLNPAALDACKKQRSKIKKLSKERVTQEIKKLLSADNPINTIKSMDKTDVLTQVVGSNSINTFIKYIDLEKKHNIKINWLGRLLSLGNNASYKMITFTKKELKIIASLKKAIHLKTHPLKFSYYNRSEFGLIYFLLQKSFGNLELNTSLISDILLVDENIFPIKSSDLIPKYRGKEIGKTLRKLEIKWIQSKFKLSKSELLRYLDKKNTDLNLD